LKKIKLKFFLVDVGGQRGYTSYKKEIAKSAKYADLKEFFKTLTNEGNSILRTIHYPQLLTEL
jgi:hypothetical protein